MLGDKMTEKDWVSLTVMLVKALTDNPHDKILRAAHQHARSQALNKELERNKFRQLMKQTGI